MVSMYGTDVMTSLTVASIAGSASPEYPTGGTPVEVSIVMPCLNESETLAACITKAQSALRTLGVVGEVVVADNGSTDGSQTIAVRAGARVVDVELKGYGHALMGGIAQARGRF